MVPVLQIDGVIANYRVHFVVLNILVLVLVELGNVLSGHLQTHSLQNLES